MGLAVVTGGAGALGRAIGLALGRSGHHVLLVDVSERVHEAVGALQRDKVAASACVADLADAAGADAVATAVDDRADSLDVLVNNAGINLDARAATMTPDEFRTVIRVDLVGPARLCQRFAGRFADGAAVVNISSRAALGNFGQANYVAAKAGLVGLTRSLAIAWAPRVRVNAVAPGLIDTPMTAGMPPDVLHKLVARIPAGQMGSPSDVAEVVGFLASPAASYVTGQFVPVCGGRSIG